MSDVSAKVDDVEALRAENALLRQEVAGLREDNQFLMGVVKDDTKLIELILSDVDFDEEK